MPEVSALPLPHMSLREVTMKRSWQEAKRVIDEQIRPLGTEKVTLEEALSRVLAEDIKAEHPIPYMATSAMDGYAVKSGDTPGRLRIAGEVYPGEMPPTLSEGEAYYVATGAFIPEGSDTVIRVEDARIEGNTLVVEERLQPGEFVNPAGSEVKKGETVLEIGTLIDWRILGLLAYLGRYQISVYQRPQVGVIITGEEIAEVHENPAPYRTRNSNIYMLKGLLKKEGAEAHYLGRVEDSVEAIKRTVEESVRSFHATVTVGGVSKGKKDFVKRALEELGAEILITQTNVKPGRPFAFATLKGHPIFCLPGYPSATLVNALEFLIPAIRKMQGMKDYQNRYARFTATEEFRSRKGMVYFIRVNLKWRDGRLYAYSAGSQLTSNYRTSATCEGLLILPEEVERLKEGETAEGLILSPV